MSKMKEEFCRQQDLKALQPDAPDDSDYNAPTEYAQITGGDWRPDDWLNENGEPKISHPLYEAGASAMLAARDKEWVEWIEKNSIPCGLCAYNKTCVSIRFEPTCKIWVERKRSIGI